MTSKSPEGGGFRYVCDDPLCGVEKTSPSTDLATYGTCKTCGTGLMRRAPSTTGERPRTEDDGFPVTVGIAVGQIVELEAQIDRLKEELAEREEALENEYRLRLELRAERDLLKEERELMRACAEQNAIWAREHQSRATAFEAEAERMRGALSMAIEKLGPYRPDYPAEKKIAGRFTEGDLGTLVAVLSSPPSTPPIADSAEFDALDPEEVRRRGEGALAFLASVAPPSTPAPARDTCGECAGSGNVLDEDPSVGYSALAECRTCDGTGYVPPLHPPIEGKP